MKLTVKEVVEIHQSLLALSQAATIAWYPIAKNLTKTKRIFEDYLEVERAAIKTLKVTQDGAVLRFETENDKLKWEETIKEDLEQEVEVEFYTARITAALLAEAHSPTLLAPLLNTIFLDTN